MNEETKKAIESGRPVVIYNIRDVWQMNPSATTVNNTYYATSSYPKR